MFSLIKDWVNNREAGDLRRHRGHYDVNVMNKNVLLTLTSMCLYIYICIYMHIDPYVLYLSICICICVIFILFNWFHYLYPRRTWSLALYFGKQYCTKMFHCYLFPCTLFLTTIYCEIEIRAHKTRLPALIAMKECYQFFLKTVYTVLASWACENVLLVTCVLFCILNGNYVTSWQ